MKLTGHKVETSSNLLLHKGTIARPFCKPELQISDTGRLQKNLVPTHVEHYTFEYQS